MEVKIHIGKLMYMQKNA